MFYSIASSIMIYSFTAVMSLLILGMLVAAMPHTFNYPKVVKNLAICCNLQVAVSVFSLCVRLWAILIVGGLFVLIGNHLIGLLVSIYAFQQIIAWIVREIQVAMGLRTHSLTYLNFKKELPNV
jgi:hypothetical protein